MKNWNEKTSELIKSEIVEQNFQNKNPTQTRISNNKFLSGLLSKLKAVVTRGIIRLSENTIALDIQ